MRNSITCEPAVTAPPINPSTDPMTGNNGTDPTTNDPGNNTNTGNDGGGASILTANLHLLVFDLLCAFALWFVV